MVIMETICALGPDKCISKLQELAHCQDPKVAEQAASQLKRIAEKNGVGHNDSPDLR